MYPFKGAFCGTLGVLAAVGVVFFGFRAAVLTLEIAEALRIERIENDGRCQPIGCDNGVHLPGCVRMTVDSPE